MPTGCRNAAATPCPRAPRSIPSTSPGRSAMSACWMWRPIPLRLRYRLAGTRLTRLYEVDLTGRTHRRHPAARAPRSRAEVICRKSSRRRSRVSTASPSPTTADRRPMCAWRCRCAVRTAKSRMILTTIDMIGPLPDGDDIMAGTRRRPAIRVASPIARRPAPPRCCCRRVCAPDSPGNHAARARASSSGPTAPAAPWRPG